MSELADGAARHLIEDRLDLNLIVEAGAGSGKTHSLANRMAAGIVTGNYEVEGMAAVTFTRKAAAEIRGRFQLALEGKLKTARGEERLRIEKALANLEHLFAGTIHSFCAHLLRERPVEAGIGPGFTELDEIGNEELRQRSWRDYLSRLRGQGSPLVEELQRARISAKDLDRAFATVCMFDEVEFPPGDARAPDVKAALKATQSFWKKLQALMPKPVAPDAKCAALAEIRRFRGLLRAAGSGRGADLVQALRCWEKPPDVTMKWWAAGREEGRAVREKVEQLAGAFKAETVDVFLSAWRPYLYRLVMTLLADARSAAREERRRALALNYGDLLTAAADLLRGNAGVRAALQQKYRWLFVDEFQDTDPIQAEVMLLLAGDDRAGGGGTRAGGGGRRAGGGGTRAGGGGRRAGGGTSAAGSAVRRRRPEAVHLPLPAGRHRHLPPRPRGHRRKRRPGGDIDHVVPSEAGAVRVDERSVRGAAAGRGFVRTGGVQPARCQPRVEAAPGAGT
jgi:ATP-dependent helicase/nuclease subunit A